MKPPARRFTVFYTVTRGSTGVFLLVLRGRRTEWATHAAAEKFVRERFLGTELANALCVQTVFVGTAESPRMFEVKPVARRRRASSSSAARRRIESNNGNA